MTVGHAPGRCDLPGAHVAGSETGDADPDHVAAGVVGERTEVAMAGFHAGATCDAAAASSVAW